MITQDHVESATTRSSRPPRTELITRVRALLPDLSPDSLRFQTAVLYLASRWTPNIDRLAAFAACDRELVAARARRWADHGLWTTDPTDVDRARLAEAVEIGEGRVPRPMSDPWATDESTDPGPVVEWTSAPVPLAGEQRVDAGAPEEAPGDLPDTSATAPVHDADALLASLWTRLGLSAVNKAPERRAA